MTTEFRNWARLARELQNLREQFPEHAREIDCCIYETRQKLDDACGDPNCTCRLGSENFQATAKNPNILAD